MSKRNGVSFFPSLIFFPWSRRRDATRGVAHRDRTTFVPLHAESFRSLRERYWDFLYFFVQQTDLRESMRGKYKRDSIFTVGFFSSRELVQEANTTPTLKLNENKKK